MVLLELYGTTRRLVPLKPWKQRVLTGSLESSDSLTPTIRIGIRSGDDTKNAKQVKLKLEDRVGAIFVKRDRQKGIRVEEEIYLRGDLWRTPADLDTVELYRDVIRVIWPPSKRSRGK